MSDQGILYTEHNALRAGIPLESLWSYESRTRERDRLSVTLAQGNQEFWLDRSDPLLNTILPSTHISVVVNCGDRWACGRSLVDSTFLPPACLVGAFTTSRLLRVGKRVRAIGAVLTPSSAMEAFGVTASQLVDRIVPLDVFWGSKLPKALVAAADRLEFRTSLSLLRDELLTRLRHPTRTDPIAASALDVIRRRSGRVRISDVAERHGLSRRLFARRFAAGVGLPPKLFARITRFQSLVNTLLSTDVAQWSALSTTAGYCDQAHMINEFRQFTGLSPTRFFRPHSDDLEAASIQLRGRPSEWLQRGCEPMSDPGCSA